MSYKINVATYLTKATVGSGLKIFIFFFWRRGEQGHTGSSSLLSTRDERKAHPDPES